MPLVTPASTMWHPAVEFWQVIVAKLNPPETDNDHRRILVVVAFLEACRRMCGQPQSWLVQRDDGVQ